MGVLLPHGDIDPASRSHLAILATELAGLGWVDGRNLRIEVHSTGGDLGRLPPVARDIVESRPDVILVRSTPASVALARQTRAIPIVFVVVSDPIGDGLVAGMARPGGNVTGFTNVEASLCGKWLELLREIVPGVARIAVMYGPSGGPGGGTFYLRLAHEAPSSIGVTIVPVPIWRAEEIGRGLDNVETGRAEALLVLPDATTTTLRATIFAEAARRKLPAVYAFGYFATEGGLASYGTEVDDQFRGAARYVHRILRGAKPGDLPVQAPVKFNLAINLRTAKALGLAISRSIVDRADEVIE